jgi:penicillin-binding protein 1A
MNFETNRISPPQRKPLAVKRTRVRKKINKPFIIKFIIYTVVFFILFAIIFVFVLYKKYIEDLPSVKDLQNLEISQSSTIYDKDGGELYNIYKEKRTYVNFEEINKNMVNAIVA